jgi:hypothetical protein
MGKVQCPTGKAQQGSHRSRRKRLVLTDKERQYFRTCYEVVTSNYTYWPLRRAACYIAFHDFTDREAGLLRKVVRERILLPNARGHYTLPRAVARALVGEPARPPRGSRAGMPRAPRARQMTLAEGVEKVQCSTGKVQQGSGVTE